MRALLDVNVLIALLDSEHTFHRVALQWLEANLRHGWASCPITQNGCIRILSQPNYPNAATPARVASHLAEATTQKEHVFWADDVNLLAARTIDWSRILGSRQVTDAYLLALALKHKGKFVTFDQNIPINAVPGATAKHVEILQ
ncbi:MAG: PIN domain-containing protein [Aeromicrobium sp.]|nr:PIN domain-containing protein [Burkholderiales bacterium]